MTCSECRYSAEAEGFGELHGRAGFLIFFDESDKSLTSISLFILTELALVLLSVVSFFCWPS